MIGALSNCLRRHVPVLVFIVTVFVGRVAGKPIDNELTAQFDDKADQLCGADCLFVVLCYFGVGPKSYNEFLSSLEPPSTEGYSMLELRDAAIQSGIYAECVTLDMQALGALPPGVEAIVLLSDPAHYLMVQSVTFKGEEALITLDDPRRGFVSMLAAEFESRWAGYTILLSQNPIAREENRSSALVYIVLAILCIAVSLVVWKWRFA